MLVDKTKLKEIFGFADPKLNTQAEGSSVVKSKDERLLEYFKSTLSEEGLEECQTVDPETGEVSLEFDPNSKTGHMTLAHAAIVGALQATFASKVGSKTQMTRGAWELMMNISERNQIGRAHV